MITKISDSNDCTFWDKSPERGFHNLLVNYHLKIWCIKYFWKKPLMLIIKTAFIWSNMEYIKVYIFFLSLLTSNGNVFCSVDVFWNRNVLKLFKYSSCKLREEKNLNLVFLCCVACIISQWLYFLWRKTLSHTKKDRGWQRAIFFFSFLARIHVLCWSCHAQTSVSWLFFY